MTNILKEGLDYHDLKGQVDPRITVDEYKAKMGKDSDVVTLTFTVNSKLAANDLVNWLEIGYDFVLDASVSDGEISSGKWLVFVEMNRRTNVPERIVEILGDMKTLTELDVKDYEVIIDEEGYDADADLLKQVIVLSPHEYRMKKDDQKELNEYRQIANLDIKPMNENIDVEIHKFIHLIK